MTETVPSLPLAFPAYLKTKKQAVDQALAEYLPEKGFPQRLHDAMRYSLFAGGKRIRPVMTIAAAELCGSTEEMAMPVACALELIHTYSLIHDDLPAMDDDDLRRGQPTNHKVFGEAMAILAGDTLMTYAYHLMAREYRKKGLAADRVVRLIEELGEATGAMGMAGGQVLDLEAEARTITFEELKQVHALKTGALIRVAFRSGAIVAGADAALLEKMSAYAEHLGLVFQIIDDILDVTATTEVLGKPIGSDIKNGKTTYVSLYGLEKARKMAIAEADKAATLIVSFGDKGNILQELVRYFLNRDS